MKKHDNLLLFWSWSFKETQLLDEIVFSDWFYELVRFQRKVEESGGGTNIQRWQNQELTECWWRCDHWLRNDRVCLLMGYPSPRMACGEMINLSYLGLYQELNFVINDCMQTFLLKILYGVFAVVVVTPAKHRQAELFCQVHLTDVSKIFQGKCFHLTTQASRLWTDLRRSSVCATMPRSSLATENFTAFSIVFPHLQRKGILVDNKAVMSLSEILTDYNI